MRNVLIAWNNAFRKIFNAHRYVSVKPLQYHYSCLSLSIMLPVRKLVFTKKVLFSDNMPLF